MSTVAPSAASSTLLDALQSYLQQNAPDIQTFLRSKGVDPAVASMIALAVSAADGKAVHLQSGQTVTLATALAPFLPQGVKPPAAWSSVDFSDLSFTAKLQDRSLAFGGTLTCPFTVAGLHLQFKAELSLASTVSAGVRLTGGDLSGTLEFASAIFTAKYEFDPHSQTLTATWSPTDRSTVDLNALCKAVGVRVPAGALGDTIGKLALTKASFELELSETDVITLDGECSLGSAFVRISSGPVLVVGAQLAGASGGIPIAQLSRFGVNLPNLNLSLGAAVMVASTGAVANFHVPNPNPGTAWPFDPFPLNLKPGFTIGALLNLADSSSAIASHIKAVVADSHNPAPSYLLLETQLPELNLTIELGTRHLLKSPFDLDLSLTIFTLPTPSVMFTGNCTIDNVGRATTKLRGLTFSASLAVTDESVMGALALAYPQGFNPPLPFLKGLWIYQVAGMMGLDFDKQEVIAGIMGKFAIGLPPQSSTVSDSNSKKLGALMPVSGQAQSHTSPALEEDEFVLMLGVNDDAEICPIPDVDLLILQLSSISLPDFLTATLGKNAPAVSSPVLQNLWAKEVQIYWCDDTPGGIRLPDGTPANPGFRFQGGFNFWNRFNAWSDIEIGLAPFSSSTPGASMGFTGEFYMSPISIGTMLGVWSDGKHTPPSNMLTAMSKAGIGPGGPYLYLHTDGPTFLSANWKVKILDWTDILDVTVATDKFTFTMANRDKNTFSEDLSCALSTDLRTLTVAFSGYLNGSLQLPALVGLALGPVHTGKASADVIDASYNASMVVDVHNGLSLTITGTFRFAGDARVWNLPAIRLTSEINKWSDIPGVLLKAIGDNAEVVFQDALIGAGKLLVKYIDKSWDQIEGEIGHAYDDVKNTVQKFFGIHHSRKPAIPWLRNGAIVSSYGADPRLNDPSDPNYGPGSVYLIRDLHRIHIPDPATLNVLIGGDSSKIYQNSSQSEFNQDYVITIPVAATEWPSVQDGTVYLDYNGGNPDKTFLAMSCYRGNTVIPTHYEIQDRNSYAQRLSRTSNPPRQLRLACATDDIRTISGDSLPQRPCLITPSGGPEIDVFLDGIRRHVPDPFTLAILDQHKLGQVITMPPQGFSGIPQGPPLTQLTNRMLVMSSTPSANQPEYWILDNQLRHVPDPQALTNWGINFNNVVRLDDDILALLTYGDKLPEKPPK